MVRYIVFVRYRSKSRADAPCVDDVLDRIGNAVKQAERPAGHDRALRFPRLRHGLIAAQRDEAVQLGLHSLGARNNDAHDFNGRNFPADYLRAKLASGEKAQFVIQGRQLHE